MTTSVDCCHCTDYSASRLCVPARILYGLQNTQRQAGKIPRYHGADCPAFEEVGIDEFVHIRHRIRLGSPFWLKLPLKDLFSSLFTSPGELGEIKVELQCRYEIDSFFGLRTIESKSIVRQLNR